MLEWRLAQTEVISYSGDLLTPPDGSGGAGGSKKNKKTTTILGKPKAKTIRNSGRKDESSDEDDW